MIWSFLLLDCPCPHPHREREDTQAECCLTGLQPLVILSSSPPPFNISQEGGKTDNIHRDKIMWRNARQPAVSRRKVSGLSLSGSAGSARIWPTLLNMGQLTSTDTLQAPGSVYGGFLDKKSSLVAPGTAQLSQVYLSRWRWMTRKRRMPRRRRRISGSCKKNYKQLNPRELWGQVLLRLKG